MADLGKQLHNYRLTTANIIYFLPDHGTILQEYIWQDYDLAPKFPVLTGFLDFWTREIEGKIHSVYVAHKKIITCGDYRFADVEITIQ